MEIPFPTEATNPWAWVAFICVLGVVAIAAYSKVQADKLAKAAEVLAAEVKERTSRCESREDKLIEDNRTCIANTKDLLAAALRATELSESAVELHRGTDAKIEANRVGIDALRESIGDIKRAVEEMRRAR